MNQYNSNFKKIVFQVTHFQQTLNLLKISKELDDGQLVILGMGEKGKLTRILAENYIPLTLTSPPLFPPAAAGQIDVHTRRTLRLEMGLGNWNVYLFGAPISKSPSPLLHNTIFGLLKKPYQFHLWEESDVQGLLRGVMGSPSFRGAAVTIPLKQKIADFLLLDPYASAIQSVNTIYVKDGALMGSNTDFLGIQSAALSFPGYTRQFLVQKKALIIGGGGTARAAAYAIQTLKMEMYIHNRTLQKAEELAAEFGGQVAKGEADFALIISTIPGDAQKRMDLGWALGRSAALIEMSYTPLLTNFVDQALEKSLPVRTGLDVLLWQGVEQTKFFIGDSSAIGEEAIKMIARKIYAFKGVTSRALPLLYYA